MKSITAVFFLFLLFCSDPCISCEDDNCFHDLQTWDFTVSPKDLLVRADGVFLIVDEEEYMVLDIRGYGSDLRVRTRSVQH